MTSPSFPESRARVAQRVWCMGLSLVCFVAGCGGEDKGRVSGSVAVVPPVDQCARSADFQIGPTMLDFEPFVDTNGRMSSSAHCDTSICLNDPFYFNFDSNTVLNTGQKPTCDPKESDASMSHCSKCPDDLPEAVTDPERGSSLRGKPLPDGARCGTSENALHFQATHIGECYGPSGRPGWGGSLEIKLNLDATDFQGVAYDGIAFWVRKGSSATGASILFSVGDEQTQGIDTASAVPGEDHCGCFPPASNVEKPLCSADPDKDTRFANFPDSLKCDPFAAAITLSDEWSFVPVYFSKLRQKGFGKAAPLGQLDVTHLTRLQFLINRGDWDFWLDDVTLFRAPQ